MAVVGTTPRAPQLSSCGQRLHSPPDSLQSPVLKEQEQLRVPEKYQPLRYVMSQLCPRYTLMQIVGTPISGTRRERICIEHHATRVYDAEVAVLIAPRLLFRAVGL
jgi:hypothetical protein